tara:strand:- start:735 stop:1391 length:657 start_codon:yes stop_codon:yes gene_type:complete
MEKSIETIWKEGFLKNDALVVPKINNLYDQKSIHIIDKFKRMFKINLIAIVFFAFAMLVVTTFNGLRIIGISWFLILIALVVINKKLTNSLKKMDYHKNSYEYLLSFNKWLQEQLAINRKMARLYYPLFFLSIVVGFWFVDAEGINLGERLIGEVLYGFPDIYLVNGVPLIGIALVLIIAGLLVLFGGRIYNLDVKIVYGRIFKKIEELITDLEELRN